MSVRDFEKLEGAALTRVVDRVRFTRNLTLGKVRWYWITDRRQGWGNQRYHHTRCGSATYNTFRGVPSYCTLPFWGCSADPCNALAAIPGYTYSASTTTLDCPQKLALAVCRVHVRVVLLGDTWTLTSPDLLVRLNHDYSRDRFCRDIPTRLGLVELSSLHFIPYCICGSAIATVKASPWRPQCREALPTTQGGHLSIPKNLRLGVIVVVAPGMLWDLDCKRKQIVLILLSMELSPTTVVV